MSSDIATDSKLLDRIEEFAQSEGVIFSGGPRGSWLPGDALLELLGTRATTTDAAESSVGRLDQRLAGTILAVFHRLGSKWRGISGGDLANEIAYVLQGSGFHLPDAADSDARVLAALNATVRPDQAAPDLSFWGEGPVALMRASLRAAAAI